MIPSDILRTIVQITGLLHFCQIIGMIFAPKLFRWKEDVGRLDPINQKIFKVMIGAVLILVLGSGVIVASSPHEMISGSRLSIGLSGFLAIIWIYRGSVQYFLYAKLLPPITHVRIAHHLMLLLFAFQATVYSYIFFRGLL